MYKLVNTDVMKLLRLLSAAFTLNLASYIHCQGQEIDIQINRKGDAILTVSWSVVENNTKFILQYSDNVNSTKWNTINEDYTYERSWPVSKKEYSINLNFDQPERYYRLKMEDSISPHQLK